MKQAPYSDLIAGRIIEVSYPNDFDSNGNVLVETLSGERQEVKITYACYAEVVRNLGEAFQVAPNMKDLLQPGRLIHAYGLFYNETDALKFEAKHIVIFDTDSHLRIENQNWWIKQIKELTNFYVESQFQVKEGHEIDWLDFRTMLTAEGKKQDGIQNLDTISRLVYGFASSYLITGDQNAYDAAVSGCEYMRKHFKHSNSSEGICYWYSQIDILPDGRIMKYLASGAGGNEGGGAMPSYEQIYALAGLTQTYRITGDESLMREIEDTIAFMNRYFRDHGPNGGYYSHIDSVTLSPHEDSLGINKARKNWNSIGDHAPAYLINLYLATGKKEYADFLEYTFDLICEHFPDYDYSPFMNEKFHDDWSHDLDWGIHQKRCVVGHNLKVAWNRTRMHSLKEKETYKTFAHQIADIIPSCGEDLQRGGWYDMMERTLKDNEEHYRLVWHDRKAWWQQEQGILAYYIMAGVYNDKPEYLEHARFGSAFYNGWFLDYEQGGVYFNVLANGQPYALGTERGKGSHSMAGYHSFELCYLSATYVNLLVAKEPLSMFFAPDPNGFSEDNTIRVSPDLLPEGSIKIEGVLVNGQAYDNFDSQKLEVYLPENREETLQIEVRLVPADMERDIEVTSESAESLSFRYYGDFDIKGVRIARRIVESKYGLTSIEIDFSETKSIDDIGLNFLAVVRQNLGANGRLRVINANESIKNRLEEAEIAEELD